MSIHDKPAPGLSRRRRLVASTPVDLVAFVPLALGFEPEDSVVMLTFGGARGSFHARVGLPASSDHVADVVQVMLRPALRHRVQRVVFIAYGPVTDLLREVLGSLGQRFAGAGIDVIDLIGVHDSRLYPMGPDADVDHPGEHCDLSAHRFTAQSVLDGAVTRRSREDLRASLDATSDDMVLASNAVATAPELSASDLTGLIRDHLRTGAPLGGDDLAALARTVECPRVRDAAWGWLTRDLAPAAVVLWSDVVRRLPLEEAASCAAVLGFAAWLSGDGALAWCAVDRAREADPDHPLAEVVAMLLDNAVAPSEWPEMQGRLSWAAGPAA